MTRKPSSSRDITVSAELAAFLKCRILTGALAPGAKLPTAIETAQQFGVDPNTARVAYRRLQDENFVVAIRGRGTYVSDEVTRGDMTRLVSLIDEVVNEAKSVGLSSQEIATILWVHSRFSAGATAVWYIDDWHPYFDAFVDQLSNATGSLVRSCSLDKFGKLTESGGGPAEGEVVVTTKYNIERVRSSLDGIVCRFAPIVPRMDSATIDSLSVIPIEHTLGVVCIEQKFAEISGKVLAKNGVANHQLQGNVSDIAALSRVFDQSEAITVSTEALRRIEAAGIRLPQMPVIPFRYEISPEGLAGVAEIVSSKIESGTPPNSSVQTS